LYRLNKDQRNYVFTQTSAFWASHPVDLGESLALPFTHDLGMNVDGLPTSFLMLYNKTSGLSTELLNLGGPMVGNLVHFRNHLYAVHYDVMSALHLTDIDLNSLDAVTQTLSIPRDSTIVAIFKAPLIPGSGDGELIVQCTNSVYAFDAQLNLLPGFPYVHNLVVYSDSSYVAPLTMADVDGNGSLDLLIGGEHGLAVIDYSGKLMSPESLSAGFGSDGIASGVLACDLDGDGKAELAGNFALNRLSVWEHDYRMKRGFPVAFAQRSRTMPFTAKAADDKWYLYSAADNGTLFRTVMDTSPLYSASCHWLCEYADLQRSASIDPQILPNQYQSSSLFVPDQVYIYPNPLKSIYLQKLILNIMPSRDTEVELSIFDISGGLVYRKTALAKAYLKNLDIFEIPARKLSSGVYIAVIKSPGESKRIKFAVEK
jgi:hypothetical protein